MSITVKLRRALLPGGVFVGVLVAHYLYAAYFGVERQWLSLDGDQAGAWRSYLEAQNYWLGYSYAAALSFAAAQFRRYREQRLCNNDKLAIGGISVSGFLAVAACYLAGCCGSPMLVVYLSLFGAAFLPVAKPLVAVLTTASLAAASWYWGRERRAPSVQPAWGAAPRSCCHTPSGAQKHR